MLAMKRMTASGHDPSIQRNTTPLMMVSVSEPKREPEIMTGRRLAGMMRMNAAMRRAHVRLRLSGLRVCRTAPQRVHTRSCAEPAGRWRSPHA